MKKLNISDEQKLDEVSKEMLRRFPETLGAVAIDLWMQAQGRRG